MLGTKSGNEQLLKDKFPDIMLWHCLNHRLELAVGSTQEIISGTNDFRHFLNIYFRSIASHQRASGKSFFMIFNNLFFFNIKPYLLSFRNISCDF